MYDIYKEPGLGYFVTYFYKGMEDCLVAQDYRNSKPYPWDPDASSTKIFCDSFTSLDAAFDWIDNAEEEDE
jgi:hypothetical protein